MLFILIVDIIFFVLLFLRGYSNCGLLERALVHNPANISCVVQSLQIKYISIPSIGNGDVLSIFSFFFIKFRRLAIFFFVIRCINYNGIVIFILVKF